MTRSTPDFRRSPRRRIDSRIGGQCAAKTPSASQSRLHPGLVPKASGEPGRYIELEGGPDLVAEIVSDTSVTKDTRRLPWAYFQAGIREFWLLDARGERLRFEIHRRGPAGFEPVEPDQDGFQSSAVLGSRFRLDRQLDEDGLWEFDLLRKEIPPESR